MRLVCLIEEGFIHSMILMRGVEQRWLNHFNSDTQAPFGIRSTFRLSDFHVRIKQPGRLQPSAQPADTTRSIPCPPHHNLLSVYSKPPQPHLSTSLSKCHHKTTHGFPNLPKELQIPSLVSCRRRPRSDSVYLEFLDSHVFYLNKRSYWFSSRSLD